MEVVDGGDRACGELLLVLAARSRDRAPGTHLRLLATDPAASVDLPAWCHLTGHHYVGHGRTTQGVPYYDVRTSASARLTSATHPWRTDSPRFV